MEEKLDYLRDKEPKIEIRKKNLEEKLEYLRDKEPKIEIRKNIKERLEHLGKQEKYLFGVNYKDIHGQHTKLSATNIMFVHVLLS